MVMQAKVYEIPRMTTEATGPTEQSVAEVAEQSVAERGRFPTVAERAALRETGVMPAAAGSARAWAEHYVGA